jgi:PiT family inorganic phosphate transporter
LVVSPLMGFVIGFLITHLIYFLVRGATPRVNVFFKRSQLVTAVAIAFSHGTNDAQKTMGIITLRLVAGGVLPAFQVPTWVSGHCDWDESGRLARDPHAGWEIL